VAFALKMAQAMLITLNNTSNIYAFHFAKIAIKVLSTESTGKSGFGK
jgi:hypothetical protein